MKQFTITIFVVFLCLNISYLCSSFALLSPSCPANPKQTRLLLDKARCKFMKNTICYGVGPGAVASLRFEDWIKHSPVKREGLALQNFGQLRGVQATEDFEAGTVVLEVPEHLCLSDDVELFAQTPIGQLVPKEEWQGLFWLSKLAVILAYERMKGTESKFKSWIQNLPVEHPPVPFDWDEEETRELQDDALEAEIDGAFFWFGSRYDEVFFLAKDHGIEGKDLLTREQFLSAAFMIQSRTFLLEVNGVERRFMVPFMDMFNHKGGCASHFSYNEDTNNIELRLDYSVKKGDQIFINYGENSNGHFLKYYGFIPAENPDESVQFRGICDPEDLQHMKQEDFPPEKMALLEQFVALHEVFRVYDSSVQQEYIDALRLAFCTKEEFLKNLSQDWANAINRQSAISRENERQVAQTVLKRCNQLMVKFPTTVDQDKQLLQEGCSRNLDLAIQYRVARKNVLKKITQLLEIFICKLSSKEEKMIPGVMSLNAFIEQAQAISENTTSSQ